MYKLHKLFYQPVWEFSYPEWNEEKDKLAEFLQRDELYLIQQEYNGLQNTRANLFDAPELAGIKEFQTMCAAIAMDDMGYEANIGITSSWATRQRAGGFHHEHTHPNSFLVTVMHIYSDTETNGTLFLNRQGPRYQLEPASNHRRGILEQAVEIPFTPGSCFVFPSWMSHKTASCKSGVRIMTGANFMPVGPTNTDHYNRYNFPEIVESELKQFKG